MNQTLQRIEKLAVILVILAIITTLFSPIIQVTAARILSNAEFGCMTREGFALRWIEFAFGHLVSAAIAVWLFGEAKRAGRAKWIWALFAMVYGLSAALLYFAIEILGILKKQTQTNSEPAL